MEPRSQQIKVNYVTCIALIILMTILVIQYAPTKKGFDCTDRSIQYPYRSMMFKTTWLFFFSLFVPLIVISLNETGGERSKQNSRFAFGFLANLVISEFIKRSFGRLRPHTFDFCNLERYCPDTTTSNYIPTFECVSGHNQFYTVNVHLSFYSGHSALAAYSGLYMILYLSDIQLFPRRFKLPLLVARFIYLVIFIFSLVPGFTQYLIKWHFLSDVLTGWTLGIIYALLTFHFVNRRSTTSLRD